MLNSYKQHPKPTILNSWYHISFPSDRCSFEEPAKVAKIQWRMVRCLEHLLQQRCTSRAEFVNTFSNVFICLTDLRDLNEAEFQTIQNTQLFELFTKSPLMMEVLPYWPRAALCLCRSLERRSLWSLSFMWICCAVLVLSCLLWDLGVMRIARSCVCADCCEILVSCGMCGLGMTIRGLGITRIVHTFVLGGLWCHVDCYTTLELLRLLQSLSLVDWLLSSSFRCQLWWLLQSLSITQIVTQSQCDKDHCAIFTSRGLLLAPRW